MNKSRLIYRVALATSALLLAATATMSLLNSDLAVQISLLSLGILGGLLASHLRFRMILAGQREGRHAIALQLLQGALFAPSTRDEVAATAAADSAADSNEILIALGDVQAEVAASESFLLAELTTIRQRLLKLEKSICATKAPVSPDNDEDPHPPGWSSPALGKGTFTTDPNLIG